MRKLNANKLVLIWLLFSFLMTSVIVIVGTIYAYSHGLAEIDLPNGAKLIVYIVMFLHSPFLLFISHRAKKENRKFLVFASFFLFLMFGITSLANFISLFKTVWNI